MAPEAPPLNVAAPVAMTLTVVLPAQILLTATVTKINAEAENGCFCLLPHHIDFVAALVPGLLSYVSDQGEEQFLAVDEGILVKCGPAVRVATQHAVQSADLKLLQTTVERQFRALNEREQLTRLALNKLEAGALRRFIDLNQA
jgi:F-type H+-transporting ATPase subunit epsilon